MRTTRSWFSKVRPKSLASLGMGVFLDVLGVSTNGFVAVQLRLQEAKPAIGLRCLVMVLEQQSAR